MWIDPNQNNLICYCDEFKLEQPLTTPFKDAVFRLQNYYEGYDDTKEEKMKRKLQFEKERFMNVSNPNFTRPYDAYLQYMEDEDILEYESQLKAERKTCMYCRMHYYGNPLEKLNTQLPKDLPNLCEKCSKTYIKGLVESGTANKKIARFLENPIVNTSKHKASEKGPSSSGSNSGDKAKIGSKDQNIINKNKKRKKDSTASVKTNKRQKTKEDNLNTTPINHIPAILLPKGIRQEDSVKQESQVPPPEARNKYRKTCKGCAKELSLKENLIFEGFPVCPECMKQYKNDEYCRVCMRLYNEKQSSSDFIGCDYCESWIHAKCDKISPQKLQEMSKSKEKYKCPLCRNKSKK